MNTNNEALFEAFLEQHDDQAWAEVVQALLPAIHEVDRTATQIWFHFFPLALLRALRQAEDPRQLAQKLLLEGRYPLTDQIDVSHRFFYGHCYWPEVKQAVIKQAASAQAPSSLDLATQIRDAASQVASKIGVDQSLLVGITAVGFMTLQQVGAEAFRSAPGIVNLGHKFLRKKPERVLTERKRDDSQGLMRFLRGPWDWFTITFDETDKNATFKLIKTQHLTTAAKEDKRDYHSREPRCKEDEGPIPVQCRSASCGTCWIGVLAGAEKLSHVAPLERRRIRDFGYIDTNEPKPLIRLACQAQAYGNVSIVIPSWNGIFGKFLRRQRRAEVETHEASNG